MTSDKNDTGHRKSYVTTPSLSFCACQEELSQLVQAHPRANQPGWQVSGQPSVGDWRTHDDSTLKLNSLMFPWEVSPGYGTSRYLNGISTLAVFKWPQKCEAQNHPKSTRHRMACLRSLLIGSGTTDCGHSEPRLCRDTCRFQRFQSGWERQFQIKALEEPTTAKSYLFWDIAFVGVCRNNQGKVTGTKVGYIGFTSGGCLFDARLFA